MNIQEFLTHPAPLLDARSPCEFLHASIPNAHPFSLFSDTERAAVGTTYKQQGRNAAVKLGLTFVGPKLASFVEQAEKIAFPEKTVRLYCARGGMRSSSLAWLLRTAGFECVVLSGGYKIFRQWVLQQFEKNVELRVLGGLTGSGKTEQLDQLRKEGEQVIDLESLACHKGSAFGHLGQNRQPSAEYFENLLAIELSRLDPSRPCWVEDESRMIGTCPIPKVLWMQMKQAPLHWIDCPKEKRIERLLAEYGTHPTEALIDAARKLEKRLGGARTTQIVEAIRSGDLTSAIVLVLDYYDKAYLHSKSRGIVVGLTG